MRPKTIRLLTSIAVVAACVWTATYGWSVVRFSRAGARVASSEDRAQILRHWIDTPGLAASAREAALPDAPDPSDVDGLRKRHDQFAAIVSVRPMSSLNWLSLASMRLAAGQPFEKVLAALQLSFLTGANEGHAAAQRGIFGLWLWESLPSQVRTQTISGLAAALLAGAVSDKEQIAIDKILGIKSAASRREVADWLRAEGLSPSNLKRVGL